VRIHVVGGGPAGLYFAQLIKRTDPRHDVVVFERNRADDIYGFGVVFSDQALAGLEAADEPTQRQIREHSARWQAIDVEIHGSRVRSDGHGFSAISRQRLLHLLQEGAAAAGVDLRYETDLADLAQLGPSDLLVGADGLNSAVRTAFNEQLGVHETTGRSKFIWCGSTIDWDSFRFIFEENEHGAFAVHGYPFDADTCTFLVETDVASWRAAGLDRFAAQPMAPGESDLSSLRYLEAVFAKQLEGSRLIGNYSRWLNFRTIHCDHWHVGKAVLLGDAAHTAHFSVGSGTKMALEDAVALNAALADDADLESALTSYERVRRPAVEYIQRAAEPSVAWWESFPAHMRKPAEQFMFHFLTRTPQVTRGNLRLRDRRLVAQVDRWWDAAHADPAAAQPPANDALVTPISVGGLTLPNRIVAAIPPSDTPFDEDEIGAATSVGLARGGAGLVLSPPARLWEANRGLPSGSDAAFVRWRGAIDAVHTSSDTKVGLLLAGPTTLDSSPAVLTAAAHAANSAGFDLLCLQIRAGKPEDRADDITTVRALREAWPRAKPLAVSLIGPDLAEDVAGIATQLAAAGCDLIALAVDAATGEPPAGDGAWRILSVSERIRATTGLPTMIDGCVPSDDYARTAVLSGRTDLCCGYPQLGTGRWLLNDRDG